MPTDADVKAEATANEIQATAKRYADERFFEDSAIHKAVMIAYLAGASKALKMAREQML